MPEFMAVLLDPNRLLTFGALVVAAFIVAVLKTVPEGAGERYAAGRRYHRAASARHTAVWLDAHGVPLDVRDGRADPPAPMSALTTIPDPFAARTF